MDNLPAIDPNSLIHELMSQRLHPNKRNLMSLLIQANFVCPATYANGIKIFKKRHPNYFIVNLKRLNVPMLLENADCFCTAFINGEQNITPNLFCHRAMRKVFYRQDAFTPKTQLSNDQTTKLNVTELLEVTGYILKFANIILGVDTEKYEDGLFVLKCVDHALKNEPHEKPPLQTTHLAVDILSSLARKMTENPDLKRCISGGSELVQAAIRFFTKG